MAKPGLLALVAAALATKAAAQISECDSHDQCLEDEYCLHYTISGYAPISYCQACVDEYGFSCTGYGLSIDGDCSKCARAEEEAGDVHEYIGCSEHGDCADGMYCYSSQVGEAEYTLQDCYPCTDETGYTCTDWGDSVDGSCSRCEESGQAINGCTTHGACVEGFYCASYQSQGGSTVVDCMPCVDFLGYSCADYGDSIDGSCAPCNGVTEAPESYYGYGYGGSGEMGDCVNPGDANSPVALQECTGHADCASDNYCSSYMGFGGCIVQCWACLDDSGISCAEYGDSIDGSCTHCSAPSQSGGGGATPGVGAGGSSDGSEGDDTTSSSGSSPSSGSGSGSDAREGDSSTECNSHDNCDRGMYCATGRKCMACETTVTSCEKENNAIDGNCSIPCDNHKIEGSAESVTASDDDTDPWHVFGVAVAAVAITCVVLGVAYQGVKVVRRKLNPGSSHSWDTRNQLQEYDAPIQNANE